MVPVRWHSPPLRTTERATAFTRRLSRPLGLRRRKRDLGRGVIQRARRLREGGTLQRPAIQVDRAVVREEDRDHRSGLRVDVEDARGGVGEARRLAAGAKEVPLDITTAGQVEGAVVYPWLPK